MSEKQEIIKELLEMQRKFIEYEQKNGVNPEEYFVPPEDHVLHGYREAYAEKALRVLELAHAEKASHR